MTDKNQRDQFNSASAAGASRYGRIQTRMQNENTEPYDENYWQGKDVQGGILEENRSMKSFIIRQQSNRPPRIPGQGMAIDGA